ncbi:MAG TPA: hypothetical protein VNW72_00540 [Chthoniobacterales bacterium]|jgi:hypothetical protein|nr:hypothetical protein [Chthoniobacterales bacterium]
MKQSVALLLTVALLLITVHRLPAPISEESPTPAPKRTIKQNTSEDSQRPTKRQTPSPPQSKATPQRNPFDGTWVGTADLGFSGHCNFTLKIDAAGTTVTESSQKYGTYSCPATREGNTLKWSGGSWFHAGSQTLTLNPDGRTANVTYPNGLISRITTMFVKL